MKMSAANEGRVVPFLTLNGVVTYMSANSNARKREEIVRDFKYPDPEGEGKAGYYRPAKDAIREYHRRGNDRAVLDAKVRELLDLLPGANQQKRAKIENNVRVLRAYHAYFSRRGLVPVVAEQRVIEVEGVQIRLCPDLLAKEGSRMRIIRLACQKDGASPEERSPSVHLMRLYAAEVGLPILEPDCQLFSVADGAVYRLGGGNSRFTAHFKAAMREFKRNWNQM